MMRGRYSMDRVMNTEFRGDHSGSVSYDFILSNLYQSTLTLSYPHELK